MTTPGATEAVTPEQIDAVARAIWEVRHPNPPGWAAWGDHSGFGPSRHEREWTLLEARAAIEAIRSLLPKEEGK